MFVCSWFCYHPDCFTCFLCSLPLVTPESNQFFQTPAGDLICAQHKEGATEAAAKKRKEIALADPDAENAEILRLIDDLKKDLGVVFVDDNSAAAPVVPVPAPVVDLSIGIETDDKADLQRLLTIATDRIRELEERVKYLEEKYNDQGPPPPIAPPLPPPLTNVPRVLDVQRMAALSQGVGGAGGPMPPASVQGDIAREAMAKALQRRQRIPTILTM